MFLIMYRLVYTGKSMSIITDRHEHTPQKGKTRGEIRIAVQVTPISLREGIFICISNFTCKSIEYIYAKFKVLLNLRDYLTDRNNLSFPCGLRQDASQVLRELDASLLLVILCCCLSLSFVTTLLIYAADSSCLMHRQPVVCEILGSRSQLFLCLSVLCLYISPCLILCRLLLCYSLLHGNEL